MSIYLESKFERPSKETREQRIKQDLGLEFRPFFSDQDIKELNEFQQTPSIVDKLWCDERLETLQTNYSRAIDYIKQLQTDLDIKLEDLQEEIRITQNTKQNLDNQRFDLERQLEVLCRKFHHEDILDLETDYYGKIPSKKTIRSPLPYAARIRSRMPSRRDILEGLGITTQY
jgi:hypothetical protein